MATVPLIEILQVVFAFFGGLFSGGELYDVNQQVKEDWSQSSPNPVYTFGILVFRKREALLFSVHVIFFLTGLLVIRWRFLHPFLTPLLPTYTRNGSILVAEFLLCLLSLFGRLDRRKLQVLAKTRTEEKLRRNRRVDDKHDDCTL